MRKNQTIVVTGASGFIGGRIVEALHLSGFSAVRAGVRAWSSAARIARFPLEIVPCDILQPDQIVPAMDDAVAVIHCAYTDDRDSIVDGTRNMLQAAAQAGVQRFVHLSTAEVYGPVSGTIAETADYRYSGNLYADAKIDAEKACWEFHQNGLPVTILRPSIVYGPFSSVWTVNFAKRLQSQKWNCFEADGEGLCNLVYVDDVVAAVGLALQHEHAIGQAFNINGPTQLTWNQYFEQFNTALRLPALQQLSASQTRWRSRISDAVRSVTDQMMDRFGDQIMDIYLRGGVIQKTLKSIKTQLNAVPSHSELNGLYSRQAYYDPSKARSVLGFQPKFDLQAGLRMSVQWLDHHGFLTARAS